MDRFAEAEGKMEHDPVYGGPRGAARATATGFPVSDPLIVGAGQAELAYAAGAARATATGFPVSDRGVITVQGPLIVGAGPAGMSCAACLTKAGDGVVPYVVLERDACIAPMWQHRTYRRLCLHLPKRYCQLPHHPFPDSYPTYPTRQQFLTYLDDYMRKFSIRPFFRQHVVSAKYVDELWCVRAKEVIPAALSDSGGEEAVTRDYRSRWLVVATGENADPVMPKIPGMDNFKGQIMHSSEYRSGEFFQGKNVLVVGCGNSGMEISLDLANHNVRTSMVVRKAGHVLPREIMGLSTFAISFCLLKYLSVQTVDRIMLLLSWFVLGDTARIGIPRPSMGPFELKKLNGKTPVLDVGTIAKIKSGDIKVLPEIRYFQEHAVEFVDHRTEYFDSVIFATGYKSSVPYWLEGDEFFSLDGFPHMPNEWKGNNGLYAAGFSKRGLLGVSMDAFSIAEDIVKGWKQK